MDNNDLFTAFTRLSLLILVYMVHKIVTDLLANQKTILSLNQQILKAIKEQTMATQEQVAQAKAQEDALLDQIDKDVESTKDKIAELEEEKKDLQAQIDDSEANESTVELEADLVRTNREIERLQGIHAALTAGKQSPVGSDELPTGPEITMSPAPINAGAVAPNPLAGRTDVSPDDDAGAGPGNAETNPDSNFSDGSDKDA